MHELTIEAGKTERQYGKDLWKYREWFYFLAWRDLLVRYNQTVVGRGAHGEIPRFPFHRAIELEEPSAKVDAELAFFTASGQRVCTAHSAYEPQRPAEQRSRYKVLVCRISSLPFIPGDYRVRVGWDIALCEADCVEDATRLTGIRSDYYGTGIAPTLGMFMRNNRWTFDGEAAQTTP